MSDRKYRKPHLKPTVADVRTSDSFENFLSRTGMGADNMSSGSHYGFNPITRNRVQMEWVYRGSWIAGAAVDAIAEDMTREGVEIQSDDKPEDITALQQASKRMQIWPKLGETIKWARLYGGAIGFMMIDGQESETPLRLDTIKKGQFKGVLPLDRWMLQPNLQDLVKDFGPEFGLPKFYDVLPDIGGTPFMRIHYSRAIRLVGVQLPYWQRISENLWGQSVLERLWDRLVAFDSTTNGAAQLVYKAHLRTVKIKGLREIIATGGAALAGLVKMVEMMRKFQSNEGVTLLDGEDEFDVKSYTFSGLSDVLLQFGQQISGAIETPLVRLFGQSPAGLSATGESDWRNYYDSIKRKQEECIRPGVEQMYAALYRSELGREPPKSFSLEFTPLWQMTHEQRANVANVGTAAIMETYNGAVIDRQTALKELKALGKTTGFYTNITDEQIREAEDEPIPTAGEGADPAAPGDRSQAQAEGDQPGSSAEDRPGRKGLRAAA